MSRPRASTAVPPKRFSAPETTSAVMGDFQEPKGAVSLSSAEAVEAMLIHLRFCLGLGLLVIETTLAILMSLPVWLTLNLRGELCRAEKRVRRVAAMAENAINIIK